LLLLLGQGRDETIHPKDSDQVLRASSLQDLFQSDLSDELFQANSLDERAQVEVRFDTQCSYHVFDLLYLVEM
jgi:hypothetical protein